MKSFLLSYLLCPIFLSAFTIDYEVKIYDAILSALFPKKSTIVIWTDNHERDTVLYKLHNIRITYVMENADLLLIGSKNTHLHNSMMKFVTSYKLLKRYEKSAIGGFYWKKGRPNIIFLQKNLQKYNIKLPSSLSEYIEDSL